MRFVAVIFLLLIVFTVVIAVQRALGKTEKEGSGADLIAYLMLALSMGVAGFALAALAQTAFPGDRFVFDPAESLATSLSALVVSLPFVIYFWRRQAIRRVIYPQSAGWALYLALIEMVFMTALVISAVSFIDGLIDDGSPSAWTGLLVFGAIVVFHEYSARVTPPRSDAGELQRVIGSAIGLVTLVIGLVGVLAALFAEGYEALGAPAPDLEFSPWVAMLIVGAPLWAYRWLRPWPGEPGVPRASWTVLVTLGALAVGIGATGFIGVLAIQYVFAETSPAGEHFEPLPIALALVLTGVGVWAVHRRALGTIRDNPLRTYEYGMAALGLITAVSAAIALTLIAFDDSLIVGGALEEILAAATVLVVGLAVWQTFAGRWRKGEPEFEVTAWPRRLYTLGLGIVFGLFAAGALITTLFVLLRRLLDEGSTGSLLQPGTVLVYTGLAAWHLLASHARDRGVTEAEDVVAPYQVTIICSHPGMIATRFPKQASLRVIHRGDDVGAIDDEMADEIVAAVDDRSSLVWVDEDGFRVAPMRTST
jgi:hypothetical protein